MGLTPKDWPRFHDRWHLSRLSPDAREAVLAIRNWDMEDVHVLRKALMVAEHLVGDDYEKYVDETKLPTAPIPEDLRFFFGVLQAMDNAGWCLIDPKQVVHVEELRKILRAGGHIE